MGGVFTEVTGHAEMPGEFNVWSDPEAARIVLESGVVATWVGLDVTRQVRLDRARRRYGRRPAPLHLLRRQYSIVAWIDHLAQTEDPAPIPRAARPAGRGGGHPAGSATFADAHLDVQLDGVARGVVVADQHSGGGTATPGSPSRWTPTVSPALHRMPAPTMKPATR